MKFFFMRGSDVTNELLNLTIERVPSIPALVFETQAEARILTI
ncbi:MAG: hypothetical protein WCT46_05700 [Candidatus Gracilibacteria bacterium]|jgi:hypothetical protein